MSDHFSYTQNGVLYTGNEGYRDWYARPRTYEKYHQGLDAIADNGGNYVRTIMYPSGTDIEWEEAGNYTDRLHMAQELDKILEHAEDRGLYIHWDMQTHFSFQQSEFAYWRTWCWDSQSSGKNFCYRDLTNSNFAPDFFTHAESKAYYKERLRYILARWGYSTHVAVWELFCEINNVGTMEADNSAYYNANDNFLVYQNWQIEMANFIKTQYYGKTHVLTTNFTGYKHNEDNTFKNENFDVMTSNLYDFGEPDFGRHWYNTLTGRVLDENKLEAYTFQNRKPYIMSESDPIQVVCDPFRVEMKRAMWQSLFSGAAGVLSWDLRYAPQILSELGKMRAFIEKYRLEEDGWHPGGMYKDGYKWISDYEGLVQKMDGVFKSKKDKRDRQRKADLSYLRSGDRKSVIGVITNKTYNIISIDDCKDNEFLALWDEDLKVKKVVDCENESLIVAGLMPGNTYRIKYYYRDNLVNDISTSSTEYYGSLFPIEFHLLNHDYGYIILFTIESENAIPTYLIENTFAESEQIFDLRNTTNTTSESYEEFTFSPNPTNSLLTIVKPLEIEEYNYELFTFDGKKLVTGYSDKTNCEINLENYESGIFYIRILKDNKLFTQQKITKL